MSNPKGINGSLVLGKAARNFTAEYAENAEFSFFSTCSALSAVNMTFIPLETKEPN
jgi:hypothetical protein